MKKIFSIAILIGAIGLGACAQIKNPITNNQLGGIIDTYGIAESALIAYRGLPRCTVSNNFSVTHICYKRSVLVTAQAYERTSTAAINKAADFVSANPTVDATSVISAAQSALDIFTSFETANGIK